MIVIKRISAIAVAAAFCFPTGPARAFVCANCVDEPTFVSYVSTFTAAITAQTAQLILAIDHISASVAGASASQVKAIQISSANLADHEKQIAMMAPVPRAQEQHDITSMPSPCSMGTGSLFATARENANRSAAFLAGTLSQSGAASQDGAVLAAYQNYSAKYALGTPLQNADIQAETIFGGAGLGSGSGAGSTYATPEAADAARAFAFNLANAPLPPPLPAPALSTHAGKEYLMVSRGDMARASVSADAVSQIEGERTPVPGIAQMIKQMWGAQANVVAPTGTPPGSDISQHDFDQIEVNRRYENPNWYVQVAAASPANLQREALFMQALDLHLRAEELSRLERIELLLSAINMNGVAANGVVMDQQRARVTGGQ